MSNQNLTWQEMKFLFSLTGKPIEMGTLPKGYCWICDDETWGQHGLSTKCEAVLISVDHLDQRNCPASELHPIVHANWFTDPDTKDHGENETGCFRTCINGTTAGIIPEPSIAGLKQITENFGPIMLDTDHLGNLKIHINPES